MFANLIKKNVFLTLLFFNVPTILCTKHKEQLQKIIYLNNRIFTQDENDPQLYYHYNVFSIIDRDDFINVVEYIRGQTIDTLTYDKRTKKLVLIQ